MKKSVILAIAVIYIASIITVGFIGIALKIRAGDVKYVESINCVTDGYTTDPELTSDKDGNKIVDGAIPVTFEAGLQVVIKCQAVPSDAKNPTLKYVLDNNAGYDANNPPDDLTGKQFSYVINNDGTLTVTLLKANDVIITVKSSDRNPGASLKILIKVKITGGNIVPKPPGGKK